MKSCNIYKIKSLIYEIKGVIFRISLNFRKKSLVVFFYSVNITTLFCKSFLPLTVLENFFFTVKTQVKKAEQSNIVAHLFLSSFSNPF